MGSVGMTFSVFVVLGIINLVFMLKEDMKRMRIDQRKNRFMLGVAVFMFITQTPSIWVMLMATAITIVTGYIFKRYTGMGDVEMMAWAMLGFATMSLLWIPAYLLVIFSIWGLYIVVMRKRGLKRLPGTPIFLSAFVFISALIIL